VRELCSDKPVANERFVSTFDVTGRLDFERGTQADTSVSKILEF
jgi:hypothetical protein